MSQASRTRNRAVVITGLGLALLVAIFLSPFASKSPDGLDRVAQDQGFDKKEAEEPPAKQLPFHNIFGLGEYALKGVPEAVATPAAGAIGTLITFGLAWGAGKAFVRNREHDNRGDAP